MDIIVTQQQGRVPVTSLQIQGDIDAQTYDQLLQKAQTSIQGGTHNFLLDLSGVSYISSYGIRALSQIYNWLRDPGETPIAGRKSPHLKLMHVQPAVLSVLETTGMHLYLDILDDPEKAIAAF